MDQIWKTVLAIIGSVGGAGVIIIFVGKWLAQLIADRVIQSKQHQIDIELTEMHGKFELELEQYRTKATEYTYVSQLQFETEFKVYQSLFQSLYVFGSSTAILFPEYDELPKDSEERKKLYIERYTRFCAAYDEFSSVLEQNAPFIPKHLYESFLSFTSQANDISCMYPDIRIHSDDSSHNGEDRKIIMTNIAKLREFRENIAAIKSDVRDYLGTLRIQK